LEIEYSHEAVETVRAAVVEGFYKLARGGLEVGGVLFGQRSGDAVRIMASRPIACEHAFGPSFILSEKDAAGLKTLLDSAVNDAGLSGLVPVGWYHSHTRSELSLSEQDLKVYDRYFPEPWQVSLVLRPERLKPTRANFFVRGASQGEFLLEPPRTPRRTAPVEAPKPPEPAVEQAAVTVERASRLPWFLVVAALTLALVMAALAYLMVEAVWERDRLAGEVRQLRTDLQKQTQRSQDLEAEIEAVRIAAKAGAAKRKLPRPSPR
jgi:proteasome lid subunit RPN8/RPN11/cell division protein FtsL